jgi:hypothetical protein
MRHATGAALLVALGACAVPGLPALSADACRGPSADFVAATRTVQPMGGVPPGRWAETGPAPQAELSQRLAQENALLERLQIVFDALLYCRWIELRTIRADVAGGRLSRTAGQARLDGARARLAGELEEARLAATRVAERGRGLDAELEQAAPGVARAATARRGAEEVTRPAVAAATVPLRLRPDAAAPEVARVPAGGSVSLRASTDGFAVIVLPDGTIGYAPAAAFNLTGRVAAAPDAAAPRGGDVALRRLAATNIARRENFIESVDLSGRSLAAGFETAL